MTLSKKNKRVKVVKSIKAWAVVIKADKDGYDGMKKEDRISVMNIYESAKEAENDWFSQLEAQKVQIIQVLISPIRRKP